MDVRKSKKANYDKSSHTPMTNAQATSDYAVVPPQLEPAPAVHP